MTNLRRIELENRIRSLEERKKTNQIASNKNIIAKLKRKLRNN